jgi:hypothetical protein
MAGMTDSMQADDALSGDLMQQPSFAAKGAFGGSLIAPQHPGADDSSYSGQYGSLLRAYDQKLASEKDAALAADQAAQQKQQAAQTAAQRHSLVMTEQQRRIQSANAAGQGALSSSDTSRPQGALPGNQPPMSLQQYLDSHDDDTFNQAMKEVESRHGQHPADIYDKMIADKFISPADKELTSRQKAEAFTHIGLELLKHSTHKAGQEDLPGAFGAAAEAGEQSIEKSRQQVAEQAHQEYLREQGLTLDKAKDAAANEKDERSEIRQQANDRSRNAEDWRKIQFQQGQENAREQQRIAAEDRKTKSEKEGKAGEKNAQTMIDSNGYQLERDAKTNRWKPSLDADGNKIKPEKAQEFDTKQSDQWQKARTSYIENAKKDYTKWHDPKTGAALSDDDIGAQWEKDNPKPGQRGGKTVDFSTWK